MSEVEIHVVSRFGTKIATLPEANLDHAQWDLNLPGDAQFSIDPMSPNAEKITWPNEIQIWWDGVLRWWGVPWSIDGDSNEVTVQCEGLLSLFSKRFVDRTSLLYTSLDQGTIAWSLLNYAQSESVEGHRNFNINSAAFSSSTVRSRNYDRAEHANILDLLYEFDSRTLKDGIDWDIWFDGTASRLWTPYFPSKGTSRPNQAMRWDSDGQRNIASFGFSISYLTLGTLGYVTGGSVTAGDTTIKKEGKYEDTAASALWGQMQFIKSEGSQLDTDWLDDRAYQEVQMRKNPQITTDIKSATTQDSNLLGVLVTGDTVPVYIDHGMIQVDADYRIYSVRWDKDDSMQFTFGKFDI